MSINHATIGIPTFGQLQTAVKALGYDVFDCIDHAKKAGVADWMDPDALRYAREFVPFIEEVAPKGKLSFGTKVWFKCLNYSSGTRHGACGAMCFTWGDKSHGIVCTMVCIVIPVAIAIIKGKVPNTGVLAFWIAAVVMGVLKIRCFWIAWTVSFVVCAYLCGIGRTGIEREEEGSAIRLMPVLFIGVLLATSVLNASEAASSSDGTTASGWSAFDQEMAPIVDALKGTDARIFSSDDTLMNYFEWEDIKVSYDMRPEIWAKAIAGERTHDDYKRYVDVVNAKSFKTLNDGYWDVAIIRKDEQRLFEKEVRGSEKIVSTSRYCLYRLK